MNDFNIGIISLIKSALTASPLSLPDDFNWNSAYAISIKHQITPLLYYGIHRSDCEMPDNLLRLFRERMIESVILDEIQMAELARIQRAFEEYSIDFMPLKGIIVKPLYPDRALRIMSDIDILIHKSDFTIFTPIMQSLGYQEKVESDHEFVWYNSNHLIVELHKRLIPSYNKDFYSYYDDGWKFAHPMNSQSHQYQLSKENQFIYLFTHFSKHYRDGGAGIRHLVDLWVYQTANPDLDSAYIKAELLKLKLYQFYLNICNTLNVWFGNRDSDNMTDFITNRIFESGSYGTEKSKAVALIIKKSRAGDSAKVKRNKAIIQRLFLPCEQMADRYPILKRLRFLLPLFWFVRIFDIILFHREKISKQKESLNNITSDKIDQYQRELEYVGL